MASRGGSNKQPTLDESLHHEIELRLAAVSQRYTVGRREVVEALAKIEGPADVPAILKLAPGSPVSTTYRTLTALTLVGVVHRVTGTDDAGYFELSEEIAGEHHHHAFCEQCGKVADIESAPALERALKEAARIAGGQTGFDLDSHRIDFFGTCSSCASR